MMADGMHRIADFECLVIKRNTCLSGFLSFIQHLTCTLRLADSPPQTLLHHCHFMWFTSGFATLGSVGFAGTFLRCCLRAACTLPYLY